MNKYTNIILVPKLNNSGGVTEIIYLKKKLESTNSHFKIVPLFGSKVYLINGFLGHFQHWVKIIKQSKCYKSLVLTHYTTLFFSLFLNRKTKKSIFIQCLEWKVISKNKIIQFISKILHFICLSRIDNFIYANKLLKEDFERDVLMNKLFFFKKSKSILYPVGHRFLINVHSNIEKDIDILIILRNNWVKRHFLYINTLSCLLERDKSCTSNYNLRIINLSSEKIPKWINNFKKVEISEEVSHQDLFSLYKRSKLLLYLSCYEGFGLPPLEAMSLGCIPIISDNRGQYNYMDPDSDLILKKNCSPEEIVCKIILILNEKKEINKIRKKNLLINAQNYYNYAENKRKEEINNLVNSL